MSATGNEELGGNESAQIYYLDGNFGIGTQEPKSKLHLSAGNAFGDLRIFSPKDPEADFAYDGGSDSVFSFDNYGADSGTTNYRHGNRDLLVIRNDGNIGIGTTNPTQRLTLGTGNIFLPNAKAGLDGNLYFGGTTDTGEVGMRLFGGNVNGQWQCGFIDVRAGSLSDGLRFRIDTSVGATERMRINAAGNVGIGTASIARTLHVEGSEIHSGGTVAGFSFGNRETATFTEHPTVGERWVWYSSGGSARLWSGGDKLGIRPDGTLHLLAASNPLWITARWGANPDAPTNIAEISNDVDVYKTLMIVGNRSAGMGRRVSVWDRLEMNGTFVNNSSITTKQDVRLLSDDDYQSIHTKLMETPLYHYRFRADGINHKSRIGVISEESPVEILDETGKYVSMLDYLGFLFVAVKAQAKEIKKLQAQLSARTNF